MPSSPSTPPPSLWAHSDPLLRRLRLLDSSGRLLLDPAGPGSELRDAQVVGFLFGSELETTNYGREFYSDVLELSRRNPHRFKCIYVSIDPNEAAFRKSIQGRPYLSCVFNDGSSPDEQGIDQPTAHDEDYVHSLAEDTTPVSKTDKEGNVYQRPLSRIALGEKFDVLSVPTLALYHLPTQQVLSSNVRPIEIRSDKRQESMERWLRGENNKSEWSIIGEVIYRLRWTLALAVLAIFYNLLRHYGGARYDLMIFAQRVFFPQTLESTDWSSLEDETAKDIVM